MALRKTKLLNITSVTGISTIGILTAGVTAVDPGTAGTCYVKNIIMITFFFFTSSSWVKGILMS